MCTTVTRRLCAFTLVLDIQFENNSGLAAGAFTALVNGWESATEDMWSGPLGHQHFGCCTVSFDMITRTGSGRPGSHQIDVVSGPQTSFVNALGPDCTGGRWDALDTGNVAAHESGHLLGLPDEYDYNGPGGTYQNLNPQPAGQAQSIMAQTWGNVAALPSHVQTTMGGLEADCPWWCCFHWPIHWLGDAARISISIPLLVKADLPVPEEVSLVKTQPSEYSPLEALELARDGKPSSLMDAVRTLTEAGAEAHDAILVALEDKQPVVRWVGLAAGDSLGDEEVLEIGMRDDDLRLRVAAASGLARRQRRDSIAVLLEGLTSNQISFGHPPQLLADQADQALVSLAGESVAATSDSPEAKAARWRRWAQTTD
ncbi:MAG: hypothetical protein M3092_06185 [Actinomycetia bacterium]|nr:hypothetical protein [Actinomycetes bacterium]